MPNTKPTSEQVTFLAAGTGAVQRTALSKFRDTVSVKDFGAVGDGVTNDSVAIQAAATYCSANSKSLLFVSGATYLTSGTLSIGCDIEGNNSTIKGYLVVAADDIVICDLNLISTNSSIALYLAGSTTIPTYYSRITLDNVRITFNAGVATSTSFGLYASNINYLKVRNCNIQYGVQLIGCTDYLVSDSILDGDNYSNQNELIHASYNSVGQITNNTFINSLDNCIDLYSSGAKTVITGNRFLGCKTRTAAVVEIKITLTDNPLNTSSDTNGWSEQIIIDGNYFGNTIAFAAQHTTCISIFYLDSRAAPSFTWAETPRNIIISNNIFDGFDATLHGSSYFSPIYLVTATSVLVQGNIFRDMAIGGSGNDMSSCIWIEECRNILVDGNSLSMKNGTGVSLHKTCFEISVVNNHMLDDLNKSFVLNYGIRITKEGTRSDPVIYQSKFTGNTISCSISAFRNLYTAAGSMTDCVINDNVFLQECSMQTLSKSIVSNNIFSCTAARNHSLAFGNATAITAHNTVVGNKFNTPSGTPKPGITLNRMRGSTVSQNMFQTATYGILVVGTNVAGELDYLNIKDNFSISQTQPNFPFYSLMNVADTALLQASNNQMIT
jgi:hypothetical protein